MILPFPKSHSLIMQTYVYRDSDFSNVPIFECEAYDVLEANQKFASEFGYMPDSREGLTCEIRGK